MRAFVGRTLRVLFLAAWLPLSIASASSAPPEPRGYFIHAGDAAAPRDDGREEGEGAFTLEIRREAPDESAERLLRIAESVYPPRSLLESIAYREGYEMGADTADAPLWWCQGVGARRVPYAITASAVAHFARLTELYRARRFREAATLPLFSSGLVYRATIAPRKHHDAAGRSFTNVYVASLALSWTYDDGTIVPVIEARRTVVLGRDGSVLAVEGDGAAVENVAISSHLGVGRREGLSR